MAPRCRSTWETAPLACFILTASFLSITFAKPFQSEELTLSQTDVHYYTTSSDYEYVKPVRLGTRHQRSVEEALVTSTIEFSVEGFDQVFDVQLHASMDLFNAGLLVRRVGVDGQVRIEQPTSGCYHQGHLKDMEDTTSVSLSTCDGLVGLIRTPEADFALKPLKEDHILTIAPEEGEGPTHIMYIVSPADMATLQVDSENERRRASDAEGRETSGTKYVETSVVADSTMFNNHGDDTEFYLFTILNQVAGLFRDNSLSADLRLLITSITILEVPQSNLDLTDELSHSLKNFCEWQKDETSDISVLLTRRDLEIGGNHAVMGKAKDVGGACDASRRCIIAEDHGPSGTIFTLAHEIGHSLGMYHDDAESGCANDKNIMATDNSGGSEAFKWSRCSNQDLKQFLSTSDSECLVKTQDDFPAYNSDTVVMPGHFYDAVQQCQMTFGPEATVAEDYIYSPEMCLELQCMVPGESDPVTNHIPALDGTKCGSGRGMICVHGQCLKVVSMYDCEGGVCVPEWLTGSFGDCQPDCYTYRNVFCVERRDDSTTVLVPDESMCPEDRPAEREYCCDSQPVVGETSYQVLSSSCSVSCGTGVETRVIACVDSEGTTVNDTFCTDTPPAVSVQCTPAACPGVTYVLFYSDYGECSVTCDNGLQSRTAFCSTSTGTSESVDICRFVFPSVVTERACNLGTCQGTVVETYFYQTSPVGDCSVTCGNGVQQLDVTCQDLSETVVDDINCASLQRPASSEICILEACTETYRYVATSFGSCSVTCGTGMRTRTIFCLNEANQVMDAAFCAGLSRPTSEEVCTLLPCTITYSYEADPFPECTLPCGSQVFTRLVTCRSSEGSLVSDVNCVDAGLEAPATIFDCNLEPCGNYIYSVGEYGECSATCGIGIQQRSVICIDLDNENQTVSNDQCSGTAPTTAILCNLADCPTEYSYLTSSFSDCNCAGIQTRFVVCITFMNGAPVRANDQDCAEAGLEQPADSQSCQAPATCNPVWRFGEWSDCSVTCGNGVQTRVVFCVESEDSTVIVPSTSCNATEEPSSVQICNSGDCVTYTWVSENYGDCSVTCGDGVRVRNVLCYAISGGAFELVDGSLCDPALEPSSLEICDLEDCGGVYDTTLWSACSVTCALGVQTREVFCVTTKGSGVLLDETECSNMTRPSESRDCYLDPCPLPYGCDQTYTTEGSITYTLQSPGYPLGYPADLDCSKVLVAPEGSIISITFSDLQLEEGCAYDAVRLIDEESNGIRSLCDEVELPYTYESTGPQLEVLFMTDATVSRRGFSATYQAVPATVLEIVPGEWEECSVTCGEGVEQRDLECEEDGRPVDFMECIGLPTPPSTRPCTQEDCPLPGACGENILRLGPGSITSPDYPNVYPENVTCVNTIRAPPGYVIFINFRFFFFLNQLTSCEDGDSLVIQDTSSNAPPEYLCQDTQSGLKLTSLTNEVSVTFVSDGTPATLGTGFFFNFTFVQPDVDLCGGEVTTSGQPIYSPDYPESYEANVTCVTNITNAEGCINIEFLSMDINNGDSLDDICREDVLVLSDYNNPSLSQTYCRQSAPETRWLSASGNVQVTFESNSANSSQGYIAIPRFVECPQAFWVPLPFGNCSASCGLGNRTRELECLNALTNVPTDPNECPEEEPPRTELCFLEECPSCDARFTEGNRVIEFPLMPDYYLYNDECTLTITNENGCMMLFFISLDIDESMEEDDCDGDYLTIFDPANMYANEPYCENSVGSLNYQTLGSTVELTLSTARASRFKSVEVFPSFGSCPTHAFVPGPWSECSASCEGGVRSRVVNCLNLGTEELVDEQLCETSAAYDTEEDCNTEECPECSQSIRNPGVIVSPGFETDEGYDNNLDCVYNISNPDPEECVIISFDSFDLGEPSLNCSDYVEITDLEGDVRSLYCGLPENTTAPVFYSRSSFVQVVFRTDGAERNDGFEALVSFGSCPEFGFFTGNFSECSVTCGEGVESRDVECRRFSTGQVVSEEICRDERPVDWRPCSQPECPSCDRVLTEQGIFMSPNGPMNYEDNQECEYTLISNPEECIRVSFIGTFELGNTEEEDCEEGDYIELSDENWDYLDTTYCGNERPPVWRSRTNVSSLTFYSDEEDTFRGFTAYLAFVPCPQYGFTVEEYGECDTTCGRGVQTREVECKDLTTDESVSMSVCTDPLPPSTRECDNEPCPRCFEAFTESNVPIQRDDFMENERCVYNITSLEGQCVRVYLIDWDLSPPPNRDGECEGDTLLFVDAEYPERTASVCGRGQTLVQFLTYGPTGLIYFNTDDEDNGGNFQIFTQFEDCPEYGYTESLFGECSVTCGGGIRRRNVTCTRLETGESVGSGNCTEDEPTSIDECNTRPCFDCNMNFNQSATIISPGYPGDYPENLNCVYEFTNPMTDGCWSVVANDFDVESYENGICADVFYVEDKGFEGREGFPGCGDELAERPLLSFSDELRITFYTNGENASSGFNVSVNAVTCPQYGYLSGPYSECSVSCGFGVRFRNVTCQDLTSREAVNESLCNDNKPYDTYPCREEECPSCDELIFEDAQYVTSPSYPDRYDNEQSCSTTIVAPEGMCVNLFIISLQLQAPDMYAGCYGSDFLQFIDTILAVEPYFDVDQVYCGSEENILWTSTQNIAVLNFGSDEEDTYGGYEIYSSFVDCQQYIYGASPFGECSVTCGLGERTREIACVDRNNNYTQVSDDLCSDDTPPILTIPCYDEECPEACYLYIEETQNFTSPRYPELYENNLDCTVQLYNPDDTRCWEITFYDFDLEAPSNVDGCYDELTIGDLVYPIDDTVYCDSYLPPPYISLSNNIEVLFTSDYSGVGRGFSARAATVDCVTDYAFIPGPWSECSVSCGDDGIQTRELECIYLRNRTVVDASFCNGSQPIQTRPCEDASPCPPCYLYINETQNFTSPGYPELYENNFDCTVQLYNPDDTRCWEITFYDFDLEAPSNVGRCYDELTIGDLVYPIDDTVYCDSYLPPPYISLSNNIEVLFTSDYSYVGRGFSARAATVDCVTDYAFIPGPWSECSVSCGDDGIQTGELECIYLRNRTVVDASFCNGSQPIQTRPCEDASPCPPCYLYINETQNFTSPGYPELYENNFDCTVQLYNPDDTRCWEITFYDFDLEAPSNVGRCYDELTIGDLVYPIDDTVYCDSYLPPPYISLSNNIEVLFTSDFSYVGRGFSARAATVDCVTDYAFIPGPWSECSVSCGDDGIQTRELECIYLRNRTVVDASFCNGSQPIQTRPCEDASPCPPCITRVYEAGNITSPNYPDDYENDKVCYTYIYPPEEQCVTLLITSLELPEPDEYDGCMGVDNLRIIDVLLETSPYYAIDQLYCGTQQNILWRAGTSSSSVLAFVTDTDPEMYPGYQISINFSPCDRYYYGVLPFEECSVACGFGVLRRNIFCVDSSANNTIVDDALCSGDIRPIETLPCYSECPSCNVNITEDNQTTEVETGIDEECSYVFYNQEGGCNRLSIYVELPPPDRDGDCDRDYIVYSEYSEYEREIVLCGNKTFNITSRSNKTVLTLISDSVDDTDYRGFYVLNEFVECPAYGFVADEEFGECGVTCGGGIQMRNVSCIDLSNGTVVADSLCDDMRPEEFIPCGDEPCRTCSQYINTTNSFIAQSDYEPNQDCLYTIDFEDSCVAVSFISFRLQGRQDGECVDYLELNDLAPFSELSDRTFCGRGPSFGYQWRSRSGQVQIRFVSDDEIEGRGFNLFINAMPCPEQGFIAGNYSECSVTCGEGVQTRDVACVALDNGVPGLNVSEDQCTDPRPESSVECELEECPSCDGNFTLMSPTNSLVVGSDNPYLPLSSCTNTLITDVGMCIRVAFASIDIEDSEGCVNDSLVVVDPSNEAINFTLCMRGGIILPIFSTGNMLTMTLSTNEAEEGMGYNAIASRIDCPSVMWAADDIGSCSVTCGTGNQMRDVYCMNQLNGRRFLQEESCTGARPASIIPCMLDACQACDNVFIGDIETELTSPGFPNTPYENNVTCPNTYVPTGSCLAVVVVEIDIGPVENCDNDYLEIFDSSPGSGETLLRLCGNEVPANNLWVGKTGPFFTNFITNDEDSYKGYNLSLSFVPCPTQEFTVGEFGECSMICGSGVMSRNVTCENSTGGILPDVECFGQRPRSEEPCGMNCTYNVDISLWSPCSATCGDGAVQTRNATCLTSDLTVVDNAMCQLANLSLPETIRPCNLTACPVYEYVTSNYSQCSVTCGDGVQMRTVSCEDHYGTSVNSSLCGNLTVPETTRPCNLTACPIYQYVTSNYSQCSVTCGDGVQMRTVSCEDHYGTSVNSSLCGNLTVPDTSQMCSQAACSDVSACNYNISGADMLTGNISSPNYPNASPPGLSCPITFIIPSGYLLNIQFTEFNLDMSCSENITLNGDVAGETFFCSSAITLPASATYSSDSTVSFLYLTDENESNTPYYLALWQFINLTG